MCRLRVVREHILVVTEHILTISYCLTYCWRTQTLSVLTECPRMHRGGGGEGSAKEVHGRKEVYSKRMNRGHALCDLEQ